VSVAGGSVLRVVIAGLALVVSLVAVLYMLVMVACMTRTSVA